MSLNNEDGYAWVVQLEEDGGEFWLFQSYSDVATTMQTTWGNKPVNEQPVLVWNVNKKCAHIIIADVTIGTVYRQPILRNPTHF